MQRRSRRKWERQLSDCDGVRKSTSLCSTANGRRLRWRRHVATEPSCLSSVGFDRLSVGSRFRRRALRLLVRRLTRRRRRLFQRLHWQLLVAQLLAEDHASVPRLISHGARTIRRRGLLRRRNVIQPNPAHPRRRKMCLRNGRLRILRFRTCLRFQRSATKRHRGKHEHVQTTSHWNSRETSGRRHPC